MKLMLVHLSQTSRRFVYVYEKLPFQTVHELGRKARKTENHASVFVTLILNEEAVVVSEKKNRT